MSMEYQIAKDLANLELRLAQLEGAIAEIYNIVKPKKETDQ